MPKNLFLSALLSLTALTSIFTALAPVSTRAAAPTFMVSTRKGINLRDENCQQIGLASYGKLMQGIEKMGINCNINGENQVMIAVANLSDGKKQVFVARKFIEVVNARLNYSNGKSKITATSGLNLRDENCHKITTLNYNSIVNTFKTELYFENPVCQVNNSYYLMASVSYENKTYYMASSWLEAI